MENGKCEFFSLLTSHLPHPTVVIISLGEGLLSPLMRFPVRYFEMSKFRAGALHLCKSLAHRHVTAPIFPFGNVSPRRSVSPASD